MQRAMTLIADSGALAEVCSRLATHNFVTVDTEFLRETTFWPKVCVIQIASPDEAVAIDALAEGLDLAPFFALMADPNVVKVFHAARQDIEIMWNLARLVPAPLFDTQVAAMVCGYGDQVSYGDLVQQEFEPHAFGATVALLTSVTQMFGAFGPALLGFGRDLAGGYGAPIVCCALLNVCAGVAVVLLRPGARGA